MDNKEEYYCKECGAEASLDEDGNIQRTCEHTGTIVALMKATARGIGRTNVV